MGELQASCSNHCTALQVTATNGGHGVEEGRSRSLNYNHATSSRFGHVDPYVYAAYKTPPQGAGLKASLQLKHYYN